MLVKRRFVRVRHCGVIHVCIPAYRSGSLILETLSSLQRQSYPYFQAVISIDGNDQETADICTLFLSDSRFRMVVQKERLGWVQNTNWLLARGEGDFIAILPHDDLLHPLYYEELVGYLSAHPECALVYSDMEAFSEDDVSFRRFYATQDSLKGSEFYRIKRYLSHYLDCPGFRGLIPIHVLDRSNLMENNSFDDFAADTVWMGKIAKRGELHRIRSPLCRKRYHSNNTSQKWFKETNEVQREAWRANCSKLLEEFLKSANSEIEKKELFEAAEIRFTKACSRFANPNYHG